MTLAKGYQSEGCIFNTAYTVGRKLLHIIMKDAGITLKLALPWFLFWAESASTTGETDLIDVTFVDDECLILMAPNFGILDRGIEVLLEQLLGTFSAMD